MSITYGTLTKSFDSPQLRYSFASVSYTTVERSIAKRFLAYCNEIDIQIKKKQRPCHRTAVTNLYFGND